MRLESKASSDSGLRDAICRYSLSRGERTDPQLGGEWLGGMMFCQLFQHHICPSPDLSKEDKSVSSQFSLSLAALRAHWTEASTQ